MIETSYFGNKAVREAGRRLVAISLGVPRWWKWERYEALNPTREMIDMAHAGKTAEYAEMYSSQILSRLDPESVYEELDGAVLFCWEKAGKFCHRRLVAEWLEKATGNPVPESEAVACEKKTGRVKKSRLEVLMPKIEVLSPEEILTRKCQLA